jgi:hypothetical protein
LFPAASTRALISLLVPAAPVITTTTCTSTKTERQDTSSIIGHGLGEGLRLQKGEQLLEASSVRELQLQQLTAAAVVIVVVLAVHKLRPAEC